jgi:hypothetical protein
LQIGCYYTGLKNFLNNYETSVGEVRRAKEQSVEKQNKKRTDNHSDPAVVFTDPRLDAEPSYNITLHHTTPLDAASPQYMQDTDSVLDEHGKCNMLPSN